MNENKETNVDVNSIPAEWLLSVPHALGALSLLSPLLGFIAPLFFWLAKRDEDAGIEVECRKVLNFQVIYLLLSLVMNAVSLATPLMTEHFDGHLNGWHQVFTAEMYAYKAIYASGLLVFGFCSLAAYKTSKGIAFKYPVSVRVIRKPAK